MMSKGKQLRNIAGAVLFGTLLNPVFGQENLKENEVAFEKSLIELNNYQREIIENYKNNLSDGNFSWSEQENIYSKLNKAENTRIYFEFNSPSKYSTVERRAGASGYYYVGEIKDSRLLPDKNLASLQKLLKKNLRKIDIGKPQLEKYLEEKGNECSVDKVDSSREQFWRLFSVVSALFVGYKVVQRRRKSEELINQNPKG